MELRIKELSKENGISITKLAEMVGITQPNMSNIANNKTSPSLELLDRIATALNVDITELFAKRGDFVAFVRDQGKIYTFDTIEALKEFTDAAHELTEEMR